MPLNDWSEHCIAAQKALANAQANACLRHFEEAYRQCSLAMLHLDAMRDSLPVASALKEFHV